MASAAVAKELELELGDFEMDEDITEGADIELSENDVAALNGTLPPPTFVQKKWGHWEEGEAKLFWVRSEDYLTSRVKQRAAPAVGETVHVGLYKSIGRQWNIFDRVKADFMSKDGVASEPGTTFFLVNLIIPGKKVNAKDTKENEGTTSAMFSSLFGAIQRKKEERSDRINCNDGKGKKSGGLRLFSRKDKSDASANQTVQDVSAEDPPTEDVLRRVEQEEIGNDPRIWYNFVFCFGISQSARSEPSNERFFRVFDAFKTGTDDFRNSRWKMTASIVDGPLMIRSMVGSLKNGSHKNATPVLLGRKTESKYFIGDNFVECDFDCGGDALARAVLQLAFPVCRKLVFDIAFILQGEEKEELPERVLGCSRQGHFAETEADDLQSA